MGRRCYSECLRPGGVASAPRAVRRLSRCGQAAGVLRVACAFLPEVAHMKVNCICSNACFGMCGAANARLATGTRCKNRNCAIRVRGWLTFGHRRSVCGTSPTDGIRDHRRIRATRRANYPRRRAGRVVDAHYTKGTPDA
jgi:hypothetical protein